MSLRNLIQESHLTVASCAAVLGIDFDLFNDWCDHRKEIPPAYASLLSAVLGVKPELILPVRGVASRRVSAPSPAAIWFKFRGPEFKDADRESVLLIRRLGHNANQLEIAVQGQLNRSWKVLFEEVRASIDVQSPPQEQGRLAAARFSELTQMNHGGLGCGEYLRGYLRSKGVLLIESPIPGSQVEGCSFYVGDGDSERPCLFINTYKSTWFRRNVLIMHELGHAIFDAYTGGEVDLLEKDNSSGVIELRAQSFAKESLLPEKVLSTLLSRNGLRCTSLTIDGLARMVADSGVEQKIIIESLRERGMIDSALEATYLGYDIWPVLKSMTEHALSTAEFIEKVGRENAQQWTSKRQTTLSSHRLLLPVPFVKTVIEAVKSFTISIGKACELLMIDQYDFRERFPELEYSE